jgi:hypothetical protein
MQKIFVVVFLSEFSDFMCRLITERGVGEDCDIALEKLFVFGDFLGIFLGGFEIEIALRFGDVLKAVCVVSDWLNFCLVAAELV